MWDLENSRLVTKDDRQYVAYCNFGRDDRFFGSAIAVCRQPISKATVYQETTFALAIKNICCWLGYQDYYDRDGYLLQSRTCLLFWRRAMAINMANIPTVTPMHTRYLSTTDQWSTVNWHTLWLRWWLLGLWILEHWRHDQRWVIWLRRESLLSFGQYCLHMFALAKSRWTTKTSMTPFSIQPIMAWAWSIRLKHIKATWTGDSERWNGFFVTNSGWCCMCLSLASVAR